MSEEERDRLLARGVLVILGILTVALVYYNCIQFFKR